MPQGWTELGPLFGSDFSLSQSSIEDIYSWGGDNVAIIVGTNGDGAVLSGSGFTNSGEPSYIANRYTGTIERVDLYKNLSSIFFDWEGTPTFSTVDGWDTENLILSAAIESTSLSTFLNGTIRYNGWSYGSLEQKLLSGNDKIDGQSRSNQREAIHAHNGNDWILARDSYLAQGGDGDDTFEGSPTGAAILDGGAGNDVFNGSAGSNNSRVIWLGGTGRNHYISPRSETIIAIEPRTSQHAPDIIENIGALIYDNNSRIIINTDATDINELNMRFVPAELLGTDGTILSAGGYISLSYRGIEHARMTLFGGMDRHSYDQQKNKITSKIGLAPVSALLNPSDFNESQTSKILDTLNATSLGGQEGLELDHTLKDHVGEDINDFAVKDIYEINGRLHIEFTKPPATSGTVGIFQLKEDGSIRPSFHQLTEDKLEGSILTGVIRSAPAERQQYLIYFYGNWKDNDNQPLEGKSSVHYRPDSDTFRLYYAPDDQAPFITAVSQLEDGRIHVQFSEPIEQSYASINGSISRSKVLSYGQVGNVAATFSQADVQWGSDHLLITAPEKLDGTYYLNLAAGIKDSAGNSFRASNGNPIVLRDSEIEAQRISLDRATQQNNFLLPIKNISSGTNSISLTWKNQESGDLIYRNLTTTGSTQPEVNNQNSQYLYNIDLPSHQSPGLYHLHSIFVSGDNGARRFIDTYQEVKTQLESWGLEPGSLDLNIQGRAQQATATIESISFNTEDIAISDPETLLHGSIQYHYNAEGGKELPHKISSLQFKYKTSLPSGSTRTIALSASNIVERNDQAVFSINWDELQTSLKTLPGGDYTSSLDEVIVRFTSADLEPISLKKEEIDDFASLSLPHQLNFQGVTQSAITERTLIDMSWSHQSIDVSSNSTAIEIQAKAQITIADPQNLEHLFDERLSIQLTNDEYDTVDLNSNADLWISDLQQITAIPIRISAINSNTAEIEFKGLLQIPQNTLDGSWDIEAIKIGNGNEELIWDNKESSTSNSLNINEIGISLPQPITVTGARRQPQYTPNVQSPISKVTAVSPALIVDGSAGEEHYLDLVIDAGTPTKNLNLDSHFVSSFYKRAAGISDGMHGLVRIQSPDGNQSKTLFLNDSNLVSAGKGIDGLSQWQAPRLLHYQIPLEFNSTDQSGLWSVSAINTLFPWSQTSSNQQTLQIDALSGTYDDHYPVNALDTHWISELSGVEASNLSIDVINTQPQSPTVNRLGWKLEDINLSFNKQSVSTSESITLEAEFEASKDFFPLESELEDPSNYTIGALTIRNQQAGLKNESSQLQLPITFADIHSQQEVHGTEIIKLSISKTIQVPESLSAGTYALTELEFFNFRKQLIDPQPYDYILNSIKLIDSDTSAVESYGEPWAQNPYRGELHDSSFELAIAQLELASGAEIDITPEMLRFDVIDSTGLSKEIDDMYTRYLNIILNTSEITITDADNPTVLSLTIADGSLHEADHLPLMLWDDAYRYVTAIHESGDSFFLEATPIQSIEESTNKTQYEVKLNTSMPSGNWYFMPAFDAMGIIGDGIYLSGLQWQDGISKEEADLIKNSSIGVHFKLDNQAQTYNYKPTIQQFEFIQGSPPVAPSIHSVTKTIDLTKDPHSVWIKARIFDESDLESGWLGFKNTANPAQTFSVHFSQYKSSISQLGINNQDNHIGMGTLPDDAEEGVWELYSVFFQDGIGNEISISKEKILQPWTVEQHNQLSQLGITPQNLSFATVGQTNNAENQEAQQTIEQNEESVDTSLPIFESLGLISNQGNENIIVLDATISDSSGLQYASMTFTNIEADAGNQSVVIGFNEWQSLIKSSGNQEVHKAIVKPTNDLQAGNYELTEVQLSDRHSNQLSLQRPSSWSGTQKLWEEWNQEDLGKLNELGIQPDALTLNLSEISQTASTPTPPIQPPSDDSEAPTIESLSLNANQLNLTDGETTLALTGDLIDTSGVESLKIKLGHEASYKAIDFTLNSSNLLHGDSSNGGYASVFTFNQWNAEPGRWELIELSISDQQNNQIQLSRDASWLNGNFHREAWNAQQLDTLSNLGLDPEAFDVELLGSWPEKIKTEDDHPSIKAIELITPSELASSPMPILDVSNGSKVITVEIELEDPGLSGVGHDHGANAEHSPGIHIADLHVNSPQNGVYKEIKAEHLVSGNRLSGTYSIDLELGSTAAPGVWDFGYLSTWDQADNSTSLFPQSLAVSGNQDDHAINRSKLALLGEVLDKPATGLSLMVVNTNEQVISTAPKLKDIRWSTHNFNKVGNASLKIELDLEDELFNNSDYMGSITLAGPEGQSIWLSIHAGDLSSGTLANGTYTLEVPVNRTTAPGLWRISNINLINSADQSLRTPSSLIIQNDLANPDSFFLQNLKTEALAGALQLNSNALKAEITNSSYVELSELDARGPELLDFRPVNSSITIVDTSIEAFFELHIQDVDSTILGRPIDSSQNHAIGSIELISQRHQLGNGYGGASKTIAIKSTDLISGVPNNGIYRVSTIFDKETAAGEWQLNDFQLTDYANNTNRLPSELRHNNWQQEANNPYSRELKLNIIASQLGIARENLSFTVINNNAEGNDREPPVLLGIQIEADFEAQPTYSASLSSNTIHEGFELRTSLNTEHVAPGTQIWWELESPSLSNSNLSHGSLRGTGRLDGEGKLQLSHVFTPNSDTNARIRFYSDASHKQLLASTHTFAIKDVAYSIDQSSSLLSSFIVEEGRSSLFSRSLPRTLAGETIHWSLSLVDTDSADWDTPQQGSTTIDAQGGFSIELLPSADQLDEANETFMVQLFSDSARTMPLTDPQPFELINPTILVSGPQEDIQYIPGDSITIPLTMNTASGINDLSNLTLDVHYDSRVITPDPLAVAAIGIAEQIDASSYSDSLVISDDIENLDNDPNTDQVLRLTWRGSNDFPDTPLPANLATLKFKSIKQDSTDPITGAPLQSKINYTAETDWGYSFSSQSTNLQALQFSLDMDGDNQVSLYTDGIMIIRRLIGLDTCTDGFQSSFFSSNGRHSAAITDQRLDDAFDNDFFDFNQDGKTSLYSDGILLIRYLISPQLLLDSGDIIGQNSLFKNEPEKLIAAFNALEPTIS